MLKNTNVKTVFQADVNCSCTSYWNNTSAKKTKVTKVIYDTDIIVRVVMP